MPVELVLQGLEALSDPSRRPESASAYHRVAPASDEACRLAETIPAHPAPAPRRHGAYERWLLDWDIRRGGRDGQSVEWFFTRINRQWLRKMVAHRIADPVILGLIGKWLNAGAMQNGVVIHAEEGTPQGGPISPVLSNLYLHFVLDLWFEKKIKPRCQGEAYLVRFADDFVVSFQFRDDADRFQQAVRKRFTEFGLELAEEKTRRILFGRFAAATQLRHGRKRPDTFEFLGFKHVCGTDRSGRFALVRIPSAKSCRKFLARSREWIFKRRHWRRWEQQEHLTKMLRGFYQYFGLHHCERKLMWVRQHVQRQWLRALNSRGQRRRTNWTSLRDRTWFKLPFPANLHPTV